MKSSIDSYPSSDAKSPSKDLEWYQQKVKNREIGVFQMPRYHVIRLSPGEDLLKSLWKYARATQLKAASIISCVGSLQSTNIRYSHQPTGTKMENQYFEIISLVGNIDFQHNSSSNDITNAYPSSMGAKEGSAHVHIGISDEKGLAYGGHLLEGNIVYTTAEITLVEFIDGTFSRELDASPPHGSGYYELKVTEHN